MKAHRVLYILKGVLLAQCFLCLALSAASQAKTYVHKNLYAFDYPSSWLVKEGEDGGIQVYAPREGLTDKHHENLSFSLHDDPISDLDEYFMRTIDQDMPKFFKDYRKVAEGVKLINGTRFRWAETTNKTDIPMTTLIYLTRVRENMLLILGFSHTAKYQEYKSDFIEIIKTLRIVGEQPKPCYTVRHSKGDTLPKPLFSIESLEAVINQEVKLPDSLKSKNGIVELMYTITCKGESIDIEILPIIEDGVIKTNEFATAVRPLKPLLRQKLRYRPGWNKGYYVDFQGWLDIRFENGRVLVK